MADSSRFPRHNDWMRIGFGVVLTTTLFLLGYLSEKSRVDDAFERLFQSGAFEREGGIVPHELLKLEVYSTDDFINEEGRVPSFWGCKGGACNASSVWGPCFAPHGRIPWKKEVIKNNGGNGPYYHRQPRKRGAANNENDLADYCKPGFLIIGAGKCGTSSLYHYLSSHPRVLPASEKQIHYFKYFSGRPLQWYYGHFPTATSFLASGALMTGEASPGYLPYPNVAHLVKARMPGPKIIAIGRNPLERMYSSYRYNYATPTIKEMQKGKFPQIEGGMPSEYYNQYIFSYEDMIRAELKMLKKCLARDGSAVVGAEKKWGQKSWATKQYERRNSSGLPPLVDLDGFCYGDVVNYTVIREQWAELVRDHPEKVITQKDVHLKQSLIGRSLYTLPLEWWYGSFSKEDVYFVCTEELSDMSGEPLNELSLFLGLPSYNFSKAVSRGPYNVGGHRGYDMEVKWTDVDINKQGNLPADLKRELDEFIRPYNERLFKLTGRECYW